VEGGGVEVSEPASSFGPVADWRLRPSWMCIECFDLNHTLDTHQFIGDGFIPTRCPKCGRKLHRLKHRQQPKFKWLRFYRSGKWRQLGRS
jgi:hypothetical protein